MATENKSDGSKKFDPENIKLQIRRDVSTMRAALVAGIKTPEKIEQIKSALVVAERRLRD